jgi:hypothetical protein
MERNECIENKLKGLIIENKLRGINKWMEKTCTSL